jgi:hypothetical protein
MIPALRAHADCPLQSEHAREDAPEADFRHKGVHMTKKQSSSKQSTLASKVLSGEIKPTPKQAKSLAASVLSQDETKGNRRK